MQNNQPVTHREYILDDDSYLISRTDLKGRITYVNPAFIEVSGFSAEELIGAPHSIVRHPDMPEAAFADLWQTIEAGNSWEGLVKNRRKNGDHYWVHASVTPIFEGGEIQGYASVRVKATEEDCQRAERAYAQLREGATKHYRLDRGQLRRRGLVARLARTNVRSMRARLVTLIGAAAVLVLASGGMGLYALNEAGERFTRLNQDGLEDVARLQKIDQLVTQSHQSLARRERLELLDTRGERAEELQDLIERISAMWNEFDRPGNQSALTQAFADRLSHYLTDDLQTTVDVLSGEDAFKAFMALQDSIGELQTEGDAISQEINKLIAEKQAQARSLAEQAASEEQRMWLFQAALLLVGLTLLILMGALMIRAILRPVTESVAFTRQIAAGNLGADMPSQRNDELGQLMSALNTMRKSLGSIVKDVNHSVSVVRPASHDIATGNEDLSSRTEQQAASLEETASSMEEMTATVKQNAANAREASGLASNAAGAVRESGEVMGQVVTTMDRITESSRKVSEIIGVIDSIAFQTNILALNASVEAARAGEQGRGFAVVAGEVRNLAGRSADAAREIRALIDGSAQEIGGGAELVKKAESSIGQVVASVLKVNDIMGEIASASDEQTRGIEQINQAIAQMDEVTQQNAERVQTSARAANDLNHQVAVLANAMAVLRLSGEGKEAVARETRFKAAEARRQSSTKALPSSQKSSGKSGKVVRAETQEEWEAF
ncbi:methyl-accepting chemotaxis sensory transducer with TarH sensor /methyl-accepting chemotaxis sensory transducer with Pas/Pac sensor [Modicisalibacter xianhensis]|uniref:Methyl-accepting chemotaxis sensory transducer with TarH sensor /methyl-accepting chemotaxis sensory transducer with Pas/Pac sensor n=1 Tax=Modicisalibacter xianhensis TaxID=442341 RepID=A0A4R8FVY7_9GAMM|nr:PAS domain-containing methyl-accepting chemotaxis protein [Halomonas xianhensis]TDX31014.1 methyl-accepting chemotaxis sensory transducer with TarH sensor /methyl-accepting chemotaxis sensory transducer with Pas/Pac sensor [Halomonas xianhensis]